ncbi:MAG: hypothetical protein DRP00_03975 [Candidatus Aenigmatarchaeota archaeon]|nr:MAG: hypothetical protein DRP00_03975 [Candidatus Aenigmarchaeota archaeon]
MPFELPRAKIYYHTVRDYAASDSVSFTVPGGYFKEFYVIHICFVGSISGSYVEESGIRGNKYKLIRDGSTVLSGYISSECNPYIEKNPGVVGGGGIIWVEEDVSKDHSFTIETSVEWKRGAPETRTTVLVWGV